MTCRKPPFLEKFTGLKKQNLQDSPWVFSIGFTVNCPLNQSNDEYTVTHITNHIINHDDIYKKVIICSMNL